VKDLLHVRRLDHWTNSMELSTALVATGCTATPEPSIILWNPKVHYCIHKRAPPVSILSQTNPVHTTPSYLFKTYFNIIRPPDMF
jgi:hypothetical protein